jgi:dipeptidyl aminopeptidase/acylaminoacyl peptidase
MCGPSNLLTDTRTAPPFWRDRLKQWIGDPDEDADLLWERSPIRYVDDARAPLLVIQGANDTRVVKAESDQIVERLRALGRTVEYMVFEDEGHGFTKTANWLKALRATVAWFEKHLGASSAGVKG